MEDPSAKSKTLPDGITIRHDMRPGDLGALVRLHGILYAREYDYDHTFEPYVARPMADFVLSESSRRCIWIVEQDAEIVGCLAVVEASGDDAQLRWFLIDPRIRGRGIGRFLFADALAFCRNRGYKRAFLLTVDVHTEAAALYRAAGFRVTEQHPAELWGAVRTEQRYEVLL